MQPSSERSPALDDSLAGEHPEHEEPFRLDEYVQVVLARRWVLIAFLVIVVGAVAVHTFTRVPLYQASALILIEPRQMNVANVKDLYEPAAAQAPEHLKTQHKLLASRRIAEPALRELRLEDRYGLKRFMASIRVEPVPDTRLVRVGFVSPDPAEAARVSDALVDSYVRDTRQRSLGLSDAGLDDLRERAKELRAKLDVATGELERFRREHRVVGGDDVGGGLAARVAALNEEIARAQTARIQARAELEALCGTGEGAVEPVALDDEAFAVQRRELASLEVELRSMSLRLKAEHPLRASHEARVQAAREELERLRAERVGEALATRAAERERQLALARSRSSATERAEAALRAELEAQTGQLLETQRLQAQHRLLVQAQDTINQTYCTVMQRIEEVELAAATGSRDCSVFVVDRADVPTAPTSPNRPRSLMLAVLFGLFGGVGLCLLVEHLDRSLKSKDEVERVLGLPVLGVAPAVERDEGEGPLELVAAEDPCSPLAEAFRTIRTGVSFGVAGQATDGARRLVVTSTTPGEGKTLVSLNLAIALARAGKRVLLVDADLRRPRLSGLLQHDAAGPGLSALLAGEQPIAALAELPRPVEECESLAFLPGGPLPPNPADLLNGERMSAVLEACEARFDWVILDAPPAAVADPTILAAQAGAVLFVVRGFRTPRDLARRACRDLASVGARVVGVVLNQADLPGAATPYGAGYGAAEYRQDRPGSRRGDALAGSRPTSRVARGSEVA